MGLRRKDRGTVLRLLRTADNFVKYGRPRARERAMDRIRQARELAVELGDAELARLATIRMADLDRAELDETLPAVVPPDEILAPAPMPDGIADMRPDAERVPPNQTVTGGWPVLHTGRISRFDPSTWRLKVWGTVERRMALTYDELRAIGPTEMVSDFHCVTGWSKLDNRWAGVWFRDVVTPGSDATTVLAYAEHYSANVPLEVLMDEGFLAWGHNGDDLTAEHGYPLRLVVPSRYGWKSVKWLDGIQLLTRDERGYWEVRGYHNRADPWREERFASGE